MLKGTIQQDNITPVNIYAPNIGAPNNVKQILMDIKGGINRNTVIVRDFNTPLTSVARTSRQKINKEKAALNNTLDQTDLIDYLQSISSQSSRIYVLFQRIWNVFKDRPYVKTQNKSQ